MSESLLSYPEECDVVSVLIAHKELIQSAYVAQPCWGRVYTKSERAKIDRLNGCSGIKNNDGTLQGRFRATLDKTLAGRPIDALTDEDCQAIAWRWQDWAVAPFFAGGWLQAAYDVRSELSR